MDRWPGWGSLVYPASLWQPSSFLRKERGSLQQACDPGSNLGPGPFIKVRVRIYKALVQFPGGKEDE